MKTRLTILLLSITTLIFSQNCNKKKLKSNNDYSISTDFNGGFGVDFRTQDALYISFNAEKFKVHNLQYYTWGGAFGFAIHTKTTNVLLGVRLNNMHRETDMKFMYGLESEINYLVLDNFFIAFRVTLDNQLIDKETHFEPEKIIRPHIKIGFRL